jgi:virulence factor Mce-like protein
MNARPRLPVVVLALGAAALVVLLLSGGSSYVVRAEFADAAGLRPNFTVRLDGAAVGRVAAVAASSRGTAIVTLELDASAAPVGRNAGVSIQPSNLLGEKFVALSPGNVADPAPSGTLIPLSRTSTPTELDQVISTFGPDTRRALAIFLVGQGDALLGRGPDLTLTLTRMPGALQSATAFVSQLGSDNRALGTLIDQSDRILTHVAARRAPLGRLVQSASGAFSTLASREQSLGGTIVAAPGALAQLRTSLIALRSAAEPIGAAAAGLRRTAAPLTATLLAVPPFARSAAPTLRTLSAVSPSLDRLGVQATPVISHLQGLGSALGTFAGDLGPVTSTLGNGIGDTLGLMEGWARAIQDRDTAGHLFRPYAVTPPNAIVQGLLGRYVNTGSMRAPGGHRHLSAAVSPSSQPAGASAPTAPGAAAAPVAKPVVSHAGAGLALGIQVPAIPLPSLSKLAGSVGSLLSYLRIDEPATIKTARRQPRPGSRRGRGDRAAGRLHRVGADRPARAAAT